MSRAKKGKTVNQSKIKAKKDNSESFKKIFSLVMAVFLIGSLFAGILMSGFGTTGQVERFGKHKFVFNSERYSWQYIPKGIKERFDFDYHPKELQDIAIENDVISYLDSYSGFFITSDPTTAYAEQIQYLQYKFGNTITLLLDKYAGLAFTEETEYDIPVMNCDMINALHAQGNSTEVGVIQFKESDTVGYELDGSCLIVQGQTIQELRSLNDLYLFSVLGIYDE